MNALEELQAAVGAQTGAINELTGAVDAAVTDLGKPGTVTEEQLASITAVVNSNTANVQAQTTRLNDAVSASNPPPTTP